MSPLINMRVLGFQSDVIRKPQGQIELNSSCGLVHGEGAKTFQVRGRGHAEGFVILAFGTVGNWTPL